MSYDETKAEVDRLLTPKVGENYRNSMVGVLLRVDSVFPSGVQVSTCELFVTPSYNVYGIAYWFRR